MLTFGNVQKGRTAFPRDLRNCQHQHLRASRPLPSLLLSSVGLISRCRPACSSWWDKSSGVNFQVFGCKWRLILTLWMSKSKTPEKTLVAKLEPCIRLTVIKDVSCKIRTRQQRICYQYSWVELMSQQCWRSMLKSSIIVIHCDF